MTPLSFPLRLGTRSSPLALVQANLVRDALCTTHGWDFGAVEIAAMTASGDLVTDRSLADIGGKALWTKELDRALFEGAVDFAVHSMKDVETIRPTELTIAAMLPRADVRDRLIGAVSIEAIGQGALIGTNSPRRTAQLSALRPDLTFTLFRGNVATRLAKIEAGEAAATLLASAGLDRLGLADTGTAIPVEQMLPAPAQGAIGIETLTSNGTMIEALAAISHAETSLAVLAERAFLLALGGTCHSPVAALARYGDNGLILKAEILLPDGKERIYGEATVKTDEDAARLAAGLLGQASPALRALFTA